MVSPPAPHRRQRNQIRSKTTRPRYPPQPPRWTATSQSFQALLPYVQIDIYSDTPNILTLAYTYEKPGATQRHIVRLGVARPHHLHFELGNVHFLNQTQGFAGLRHTFEVPLLDDCYNLYYAAFDTRSPATAHSISPIYALRYCTSMPPPPTVALWQSATNTPPALPGDMIIIYNAANPGAFIPPFAATGATLEPIIPSILTGTRHFSAVPPHNQTFTRDRYFEVVLMKVTAANPTLSPAGSGWLVRGLNPISNPVASNYQVTNYANLSNTLFVDFNVSFNVSLQNGEVALYWDENNGQATAVNQSPDPTPAPHFFETPFGNFTATWRCPPWDLGVGIMGTTRFRLTPSAITELTDITTGWRKLPGNPGPVP